MKAGSYGVRLALVIVTSVLALAAATHAYAQSLRELNQTLGDIEPQASQGVSNPAVASEAIDRLDQAEADFARIVENGRVGQDELLSTYDRIEGMLERLYRTYQAQKDACINTIDNGGSCDYEKPEELALRALYPLSWLRFEGASLYAAQPSVARRMLREAVDGFTTSTLVIFSPELVRENLLGRAFAERELGKYDHSEYAKAIADFKRIMKDGADTRQYRPAEQGLATTYAAMGRVNEAQGLTARLANGENGQNKAGIEMLHLREMFRAEAAENDPSKRAQLHRQIIDFIRDRQHDKSDWAVAVASAAQYVSDPETEFGGTSDGFQNWLLANVLLYKHRQLDAAKYYWAAARSGEYPKAYRYAADLYYSQGRLEMVKKVADEIANHPGSPDAQWASYMLFKVPRLEWERSRKRDPALESQWVAGAEQYLKRYPRGQYAFEPRFRLAERLQDKGQYLEAAKQYAQVAGNTDYEFTARYNEAECYYRALQNDSADHKATPKLAASQREAVRTAAINTLRDALRIEPAAEHSAPTGQRKAFQSSRGRAIFMLADLLEQQPKVDYREVASALANYEVLYPDLKEHFDQTRRWRVDALDRTGQYALLAQEVKALTARESADAARNDYIKEVGFEFWKHGAAKLAAGDDRGYLEDAKLTALTYDYFERTVNEGKEPAKNLTGTLSILGQSYLAMNDDAKAEAIFGQVVKADPGSPDANAGLAQIAQQRRDYKDALDLWSRVESVAAESDPLFYESRYNIARIFEQEGNPATACNKLTVTANEHPNLGSPTMKAQWDALQHKVCINRTES